MEQESPKGQLNCFKPDETKIFLLIEEQRQSGLTVKAFCETKGIALHSFYYWNKKYQSKRKTHAIDNRPAFARLQIQEESSDFIIDTGYVIATFKHPVFSLSGID